MLAEEKAIQLFNKYFGLVEANSVRQQEENAKQCALIAVDEALSEYVKGFNKMKQLHPYMLDTMHSEGYKYWQEVKQEIINL